MNKYYEIGADGKLQFTANGNGLINKYKIMQATKADSEILSIANALKAEGLSKSNTVAIILDMQLTDGYGKYYTEERIINIISGKQAEKPVDEPAVTIKNIVSDDEPVIIAKPEPTKEIAMPNHIEERELTHNHTRIRKDTLTVLELFIKYPNDLIDDIHSKAIKMGLMNRQGGKFTYKSISSIKFNAKRGLYGNYWKEKMNALRPKYRGTKYDDGFMNLIVELREEKGMTYDEIATVLKDLGKKNFFGNDFDRSQIRSLYMSSLNINAQKRRNMQ